jgi:hypothetical protein
LFYFILFYFILLFFGSSQTLSGDMSANRLWQAVQRPQAAVASPGGAYQVCVSDTYCQPPQRANIFKSQKKKVQIKRD